MNIYQNDEVRIYLLKLGDEVEQVRKPEEDTALNMIDAAKHIREAYERTPYHPIKKTSIRFEDDEGTQYSVQFLHASTQIL